MATEYPVSFYRISSTHDGAFLRQLSDAIVETVDEAMYQIVAWDDAKTSMKPSPSKWSPKEIIGHLVDSGNNNLQRFVRAQLIGELHFPEYEQVEWMRIQRWNERDWADVTALWKSVNLHIAHVVAACAPEKLGAKCIIGKNAPATLAYLMEDYLGHMQHHLRQIPLTTSRDQRGKGNP